MGQSLTQGVSGKWESFFNTGMIQLPVGGRSNRSSGKLLWLLSPDKDLRKKSKRKPERILVPEGSHNILRTV
jgi:hypothetical protein